MVGLFLVFVEMTVTAPAQEMHHFTSSELGHPVRDLSIHELAQRYGITDAIEFSRQMEAEKDAHRERERIRIAQQRDRELREKSQSWPGPQSNSINDSTTPRKSTPTPLNWQRSAKSWPGTLRSFCGRQPTADHRPDSRQTV